MLFNAIPFWCQTDSSISRPRCLFRRYSETLVPALPFPLVHSRPCRLSRMCNIIWYQLDNFLSELQFGQFLQECPYATIIGLSPFRPWLGVLPRLSFSRLSETPSGGLTQRASAALNSSQHKMCVFQGVSAT